MNVQPIPTISDRINEIRQLTARIVNSEILPNESILWAARGGRYKDSDVEEGRRVREDIKHKVKEAGLWAPHLPVEYGRDPGQKKDHVKYDLAAQRVRHKQQLSQVVSEDKSLPT